MANNITPTRKSKKSSQKQPGKGRGPGKPFVKGDPRINRKGFNKLPLSKLLQEFGGMDTEQILELVGPDSKFAKAVSALSEQYGKEVSMRPMLALQMWLESIVSPGGPNTGLTRELIARQEGNVPDTIKHEGMPGAEWFAQIVEKAYGAGRRDVAATEGAGDKSNGGNGKGRRLPG